MITQDISFGTITDIAERIKNRDVSPLELTVAMLENIERLNPKLNAFVTLTADSALADAKKAEADVLRGDYKGSLHGIPIVHKDLYYTKGIRTTGSSKILEDFVPDFDGTVVAKLHEAGTIMLGKVQTHEFAAGATTDSPHFGACHNPWDVERVPGGSSGGSAACVAAGLAYMGTGSDTGGSIRIPAACCGVVGIKPTYGRVSRYGILPLAWSLDHAGPITRTVKDAAICLQAMAGYDPKDDSTLEIPVPDYVASLQSSMKGIKIGVPTEFYFENMDDEVRQSVQAAIGAMGAMGAEIVDVTIPMLKYSPSAGWAICLSETAAVHTEWYRTRSNDYAPDVRLMIEAGKHITATDYLQAQRVRQLIRRDFIATLSPLDVLVAPTLPHLPPRIGDTEIGLDLARFTFPSDITGLPTLSIPCGFSNNGLPIGLQIMGKPFEESTVLSVGYAYEQSMNWHTQHPAV